MSKRIEVAVPEALRVEAESRMKSTGFVTKSQRPAWSEWIRHLKKGSL